MDDDSGVTVVLDSTSISTTSLANGTWHMTNVPSGIYAFSLSKPGFFSQKLYNFQFVGGGTYYMDAISLSEIPSVIAKTLTVSTDSTLHQISFTVTTSGPDPNYLSVYIFRSKTPIASTSPFAFDDGFDSSITPDSVRFRANISTFSSFVFQRGEREYDVSIVGNQLAPYSYNPSTGRFEFSTPGVVLSAQATFIDP